MRTALQKLKCDLIEEMSQASTFPKPLINVLYPSKSNLLQLSPKSIFCPGGLLHLLKHTMNSELQLPDLVKSLGPTKSPNK